jgi:hypothetical protein
MTDRQEYENYLADCYVLTDKRTKEFIFSFLEKFLPDRDESADEYEIPQYSDSPIVTYKTANNLIDHLIKNKIDIHTIYWRNNNHEAIQQAMCFFTNDGQLIVGLSCQTKHPDTSIEDKYFKDLQNFCNSDMGYITYEEPAIHNATEFLDKVEKYNRTA